MSNPLHLSGHGGTQCLNQFIRESTTSNDTLSDPSNEYIRLTNKHASAPLCLHPNDGRTDVRIFGTNGNHFATVLRVTPNHPCRATRDLYASLTETDSICNLIRTYKIAKECKQLVRDDSAGGSYATFCSRMTIPTRNNKCIVSYGKKVFEPQVRSSTPAMTNCVPEIVATTALLNNVISSRSNETLQKQASLLSPTATLPCKGDLIAAGATGITLRLDGFFLRLQGSGDAKLMHPKKEVVRGHVDVSDSEAPMAQLMVSSSVGVIPGTSLTIRQDTSRGSPGVTIDTTSNDCLSITIIIYSSSKSWHGCEESLTGLECGTAAQSLRFIYFASKAKERLTEMERLHRAIHQYRRRSLPYVSPFQKYPLDPDCIKNPSRCKISRKAADITSPFVAIVHKNKVRLVEVLEWHRTKLITVKFPISGTIIHSHRHDKIIPLAIQSCRKCHIEKVYTSLLNQDPNLAEKLVLALKAIGRFLWIGNMNAPYE